MSTRNANADFSQGPLPNTSRTTFWVKFVLGAGLVGLALIFGFLVWRLEQLPHKHQPAARHPAYVYPAPAPTVVVAKVETQPIEPALAAPIPPPNFGEKPEAPDTMQKEPVDAPPHLPEVKTADQIFEERLQASEENLREQLREIPEIRVVSDDEVKRVRKEEQETQKHIQEAVQAEAKAFRERMNAIRADLDAARNQLNSLRGNRFAYEAAMNSYREQVKSYSEYMRSNPAASRLNTRIEFEGLRFDTNRRLHREMRNAALRAGLELGAGPHCQLDLCTATEVAKLSKDLRDNGFVTVPGVRFVRRKNGGGVAIAGVAFVGVGVAIDGRNGRTRVNGQRDPNPEEKSEDRTKAFQTWCDQHHLESLCGTVPTLTQMLQIEDEATRLLLVRELRRIKNRSATIELAIRAIADLSPAVRQAALAGLEHRPSSQYLVVLLRGLRYPWPAVADHAAVALRTLKPQEAVVSLVGLLDLPSPSAPGYDAATKRYTVREMVRLNHLRNCLLCHAPSANNKDGLVRGMVPTPGSPLPVQYYEGQAGDFVRADITFLRQDFSINLPEVDAAPWPKEQRYDFVTRLRTLSPEEAAQLPAMSSHYSQRDALLYALRGVTGKDAGESSARWREMLGLAGQSPEQWKDPSLGKTSRPPKDQEEVLEKTTIPAKEKNQGP